MAFDNLPAVNNRRGKKFEHEAAQFAQQFPIGSSLTNNDFDRWCQNMGWLTIPQTADKKSDAWKAHLHRRYEFRNGLNQALNHPRMMALGLQPCRIENMGMARLEIISAADVVIKSRMAARVESLTVTHRKRIRHAMQSADWDALPAYERVRVKMIHTQIENFGERTAREAEMLTRDIDEMIAEMNHAIAIGNISATSQAAQAILNPPTGDESDGESDDEVA